MLHIKYCHDLKNKNKTVCKKVEGFLTCLKSRFKGYLLSLP